MKGDPFIEALAKVVAEHGQGKVADRAGVNQATISNLLSGKSFGAWDTMEKLAAAYPELQPFLVPEEVEE